MPIAVTAALLILLSSHAGAETPWAMEAGLWRNVTRVPSDYDAGMAAIDAMVEPDGFQLMNSEQPVNRLQKEMRRIVQEKIKLDRFKLK